MSDDSSIEEIAPRGLLRMPDGSMILKDGWRNIALVTEFDGSRFAGWQRQEQHIRTVQGTLERALESICGHPITLYSSSRTDAGVHALGHVSNFRTDSRIPVDRIPLAASSKLPDDLVVKEARETFGEFNARYHAKAKTYSYYIWNARRPSAIMGRYSYHEPVPLDLEKMQTAAQDLIGFHDFTAFKAAGGQTKTSGRELYRVAVERVGGTGLGEPGFAFANNREDGQLIRVIVTGSGFLYNMMRIIAGTLLYIGLGKIGTDRIPYILASKDRETAGKTLPAHGLILDEVFFENQEKENLSE